MQELLPLEHCTLIAGLRRTAGRGWWWHLWACTVQWLQGKGSRMLQSLAGWIELTIDVASISYHHRQQLQLVQRARHLLQLGEGGAKLGSCRINASRVEVDLLFLAHLIFKPACRRERDDCESLEWPVEREKLPAKTDANDEKTEVGALLTLRACAHLFVGARTISAAGLVAM